MDNAWSSLGGGPSDLTFPEQFLGTWKVQNTLVKVETPLGPDFVPDMKVQLLAECSLTLFMLVDMCPVACGSYELQCLHITPYPVQTHHIAECLECT